MNSFGTYGWLGMMAGFGLFGLVVFAAFSIFWLWMLIDLLQRKTPDKLVWVLVLIFLNFLGAVLYYLLVYSKGKRR
ncbi:PLDc_N domain-containing protein [archaeon]|nr:MAG: PLDc_N domain-containing protein [archaeon]